MSAPETRAILIGGSSHSGKSTLAAALGAKPGWTHISTDSLARHPGRPWRFDERPVKPHVVEHYRDLSVGELIDDVSRHYTSMWPDIEGLITSHVGGESKPRLVLEGSALWPDQVAGLQAASVAAFWLTASDEVFEARIRKSSCYDDADAEAKLLIDKFLGRTLRYDALMMEAIEHHGLTSIRIDGLSVEDVCAEVLKLTD